MFTLTATQIRSSFLHAVHLDAIRAHLLVRRLLVQLGDQLLAKFLENMSVASRGVATVTKEDCLEQRVQKSSQVHARSEPHLVLLHSICSPTAQLSKRIAPGSRAKALGITDTNVYVGNVNWQENPGNDLQARPYTNWLPPARAKGSLADFVPCTAHLLLTARDRAEQSQRHLRAYIPQGSALAQEILAGLLVGGP